MNPLETLESRTLLSDVALTPAYDYLSTMKPIVATNGYGPIEKNQSNGESAPGDGNPLMIGGKFFRKGVGLHSNAELLYLLGSKYRSFVSDVGIDDEVGDGGSVIFQVFGDGLKMFDSGVMTGASRNRRINIDVTGVDRLTLIVNDAGDGNADDHADFGNARLIKPLGNAPVIPALPDLMLDQASGFLSAGGSFRDDSGGPVTGTVDWGDGRAREYLTLDDSNTFLLGHWYPVNADSDYTVTVRISNPGATGIGSFKVHVDNLPPTNVGLVGQTNVDGSFNALAGLTFSSGGVFSDPGAFGGETYTAAIDYGDGSAVVTEGTDGRFFDVNHVYRRAGTYTVTTTVTDSGGETGTGASTVIVANPVYTYLSDLGAKQTSGSARIDRSAAGSRINLNGTMYTKGIGVVADSEIVYTLGGKYRSLISDVGVDDEVDGLGSTLQFLVYADGNIVFDSGAMASAQNKRINVDTTGVNELRLVVRHAGDTASNNDHGDWAGIRLVQ